VAKIKFALGLLLLLSLLGSILPASPAVGSPDVVKWSAVNIPTEGKPGNWVLADGSDVQHLTMAIDGTLYGYATPSGTSYTLFKSTDGGYNWSYIGEVNDNIVGIATAPDDANIIGYATSSRVYKSTDAGNRFMLLPPNPGGAGSNNVEITSIAIARRSGNSVIAIGTRDTDNGQYGGIYIIDENLSPNWSDSNLGNYDVYAVAFSPDYAVDGQLVAVVTDETDTIVTARIGNSGWGESINDARLDKDNSGTPTPVSVDTSATIAFPDGYGATSEDQILFVAIDAGTENGDVYKINSVMAPGNSIATDLNIGAAYGVSNVDVTTLAVTGNATTANLMAGAAGSTQVYFSFDGGTNWAMSTKPPTGQSKTYVLMAPDFISSGRAYAATSGTESAVSYTNDGGVTWNQIGLIDTSIQTAGGILDLAPSPNYSQNSTLFMLTYGGEHSLWRSLDDGTIWERVFTSALANADSITKVKLCPNSNSSQVVFITGSSNGNPALWKSTDNGQRFIRRTTRDPISGALFAIDTWAVVNENTLFLGSYDGSNGLVYGTTNSGLFYTTKAVAGTKALYSIALSPNYDQDGTILVGNIDGEVYWSNDNGTSFELLGQQLPDLITGGSDSSNITAAFDPGYSHHSTVYAASHCRKGTNNSSAIYRFVIGTSTSWESIDSTLPSGAIINQLIVSAEGTLYAANSKANGGMERSLNPSYPLGPAFETVTRGLDDAATLTGLRLYDNQLWSIDTTNNRVITYIDSLTQPVTLTSPPNKASGMDTTNVSLDWETLSGATDYKWQLDYDTDFSTVPTGFEGEPKASSARLPALELATTYYWRVRGTEPVLSPWSAKWSFTTSLGTTVTAPELYSPKAGASTVPLKPVFQWSAIAGAHSYELLVSTDASFTSPTIVKIDDYALPATAWQCDVNLNCDTTYYWKVRACSSDTHSAWSAVGAFTSESAPEPAPTESASPSDSASPPQTAPPSVSAPPLHSASLSDSAPPPQQQPPPSPQSVPQPATPDWVNWLMYLGAALLLIMLAMLITLIVLTARIWRL